MPETRGDDDVGVRAARAGELKALQEIERAAAGQFAAYGVPESVIAESTSVAELDRARRDGTLWVAAAPGDEPIGFALVALLDDHAHLEEVDVDPRYARRGVGSALVRAVCDWAVEQGLGGVTLTTYRDIPFNAPFYARLGFVELGDHELTPALREIVASERQRGLDPARRAVMRWRITGA